MKRVANVYMNRELAGILVQDEQEYVFRYTATYYNDSNKPSISLTLPKTKREYRSAILFPFFFNMLAEGVNRQLQSRRYRIDEHDYFGLLLATAQYDTIGAITVEEVKE